MIVIRQNEDVYEISAPYDPNLIYHIKNVPGRRWLPESKLWIIPKDRLGFFLSQIKGTSYEAVVSILSNEDLGINGRLLNTEAIPEIDISKIPMYVKEGKQLYAHQLDFMKYALDRQQKGNKSGFLVADGPGLGKSLEAINLAMYNKKQLEYKHCLIICCINSSKYNWAKEVPEHTRGEEQGYILGARLTRKKTLRFDTGGKEKLEDLESGMMYGKKGTQPLPYFIIMNIEAVRYKQGRKYPIAEKLIDMITKGELNMIVIDEVHKNMSASSSQGKQLSKIKKATKRSAMWLPMSGTPINSKPLELYIPMQLIDAHNFTSYYKWSQQFCVYGGFGDHEIIGYKNMPSLQQMLQSNMIRRRKEDVLDLPPKIKFTEYVENTPYQKSLYEVIEKDLAKHRADIVSALNPMTKFLRLRQVNGSPEIIDKNLVVDDDYINKNAKLKRLLELLEEITDRGEKTLVFSNWVETLRTLYKFVSVRYKTCCFTGTMTDEVRNHHKDVFMNNPNYPVMLGTIGAMGTTHTLTAAKNVIFFEEPWVPNDKEQAEDRAHRIGTTDSVNIYTIMTQDTVDDKVHDILYTKEGISDFIVDGKLDLRNNPHLFDLLLSHDQVKEVDLSDYEEVVAPELPDYVVSPEF